MGVKPWGRANLVLGAIAAVALVAGGLYLWRGNQANSEFRTLARRHDDHSKALLETSRNIRGARGHTGTGHVEFLAGRQHLEYRGLDLGVVVFSRSSLTI